MFDFAELIRTLAIYALPVLLAITLHEAAHAYAAKYFGDTTAFALGRMTLNPLKHIDPIGTIAIPLAMYFATAGSMLFGYAKPVPVRVGQLNHPRRDMALVALAGPLSNFVMAFLWTLILVTLLPRVSEGSDVSRFLAQVSQAGISINLLLFALNLLPIPPLDGGRILVSLLPPQQSDFVARIEPYGFFIVLGLALTQLLQYWMQPIMQLSIRFIRILVSPLM